MFGNTASLGAVTTGSLSKKKGGKTVVSRSIPGTYVRLGGANNKVERKEVFSRLIWHSCRSLEDVPDKEAVLPFRKEKGEPNPSHRHARKDRRSTTRSPEKRYARVAERKAQKALHCLGRRELTNKKKKEADWGQK